MAGSIATLAILWVSLQTMGLLGHSYSIGTYKLPDSLQNYLASYTGKCDHRSDLRNRNFERRFHPVRCGRSEVQSYRRFSFYQCISVLKKILLQLTMYQIAF